MKLSTISSLFVFVTSLTAASSALAQEEAPPPEPEARVEPKVVDTSFGHEGGVAIALNHTVDGKESSFFSGNTAIQGSYFPTSNLSVGLAIGFSYISTASSTTDSASSPNIAQPGDSYASFTIGPRIGYVVHAGEHVSLWPQVGLDYTYLSESQTTYTPSTSPMGAPTVSSSSATTSWNIAALTLTLPILFHPNSSFFIGAGPTISTEFVNSYSGPGGASGDSPKTTTFGVLATVGGAM